MKKIFYSLAIVTMFSFAQSKAQFMSHQPAPPPLNPGYPFLRGMFVDCSNDIVFDVENGNQLGLASELIHYVMLNHINYVILRDLENAHVFGSPSSEAALHLLIHDLKSSVSGMQVGLCGSYYHAFLNINTFKFASPGKTCYPSGVLMNDKDYKSVFNNTNQDATLRRLASFFRSATEMMKESGQPGNNKCDSNFDTFYLEYRYWENNSSMSAMQNSFQKYKTILSTLKALQCDLNCIQYIDAEFAPSDQFKLQAWTAIDQITDADPLIDRIMLTAYTNNASGVFDMTCKNFHFLSDQFSKPASKIFVGLSAESPSFSYCNSPQQQNNFLGDYLNGITLPSGNMLSVEYEFITKFNDPNYLCPACHCLTYDDNHNNSLNVNGNILAGSIWSSYSFLHSNNLFRKKETVIDNSDDTFAEIQLLDLNGRVLFQFHQGEKINIELPTGIYFERIRKTNGDVSYRKNILD